MTFRFQECSLSLFLTTEVDAVTTVLVVIVLRCNFCISNGGSRCNMSYFAGGADSIFNL